MTKETNLNWNIKLIDDILIAKDFKLSNNTDCFELANESGEKMKFNISSMEQYYNYVRQCALHYQKLKTQQNNGKFKRINDLDIYMILKQYKLISVYAENNNDYEKNQLHFVIKDYENLINMYKEAPIDTILNKICEAVNIKNSVSLRQNVFTRLYSTNISASEFEVLNIAPKHIVLTPNGILNSKTFEFSTNLSKFGNYQFISKLPFNVYHIDDVDPIKLEIVKQIFNNWTNDNKDKIKYLKQLFIAAIDGNGRKKLNIIVIKNNTDKLAFINILKKLATNLTVELNLQDISKDNKLNVIQPNTKVVIGDNSSSDLKLAGETLSRTKSIITGESILVDVRFKDAKTINYKGLFVQTTKTLPKSLKQSNDLENRLNIIKLTNNDHEILNNKINLNDLIENDNNFMESFISYIFTDIEPFINFHHI